MTDLAVESSSLIEAVATPSTDDHNGGTNKFQKAISAWRNIDLTSLIPSLDSTASEIIQYQRDGTIQRKELAQRTKEFRKLDETTKLIEIKALLKNYQSFIDLLTNHIKLTNSAFLSVYSSLSEAPDPYPLLEASFDSLLLSEDTLPKVKLENEQLQKSVRNLTTQIEETESKLQGERKARRSIEQSLDSKLKEAENSWAAVLEEKKDNWEAKEKFLEEKLENQERLLGQIKASYEVTQRLGDSENSGSNRSGHVTSAEFDMINSDLERTSARLAEVEARNEQLRSELALSATHVVTQQSANLEDDPEYMRIRSENASLLRKVDAARVEKDTKKRELDARVRSLEREVSLLKEERDNLRIKIQKWSDYDEVKNELDVLKSIEFSLGEDDDDESLPDNLTSKAKGDSLEQLLISRNKKVTDELTVLRVSHNDLVNQIQKMQDELSKVKSDLERAQHLNSTLENDLASINESANPYTSTGSVAGIHMARHQNSANLGGKHRLSPTSSIISGFDPRSSINAPSLEALRSSEPMGGSSGILSMITAQRDRFKQRNSQLENELSEAHRTVSSLRHEVSSLQKDNLNLYEKTRYVSTYNRAVPTALPTSPNSLGPNSSMIHMSNSISSGISLDRYRSAYESNISPFAAFRGRESVRAYKRMSLPDRIILSMARLVLATKLNRNLFAGYCVALHLLVFLSLYWLGSVDIEKNPRKLGQAGSTLAAKVISDDWHQAG